MKANLNQDILENIGPNCATEIGIIPPALKKVGQDRLRFDGTQIVDLADRSEIWVEKQNGAFILHCIEVSGSQLVAMTYRDRRRLTDDGGTYRLKTQGELLQEQRFNDLALAKQRLKRKLKDQNDLNHDILALIFAVIFYARTQNAAVGAFFDEILPDIRDVYPFGRVRADLTASLKDLKTGVAEYWQDVDNVGS